jgi:hypothetical protein
MRSERRGKSSFHELCGSAPKVLRRVVRQRLPVRTALAPSQQAQEPTHVRSSHTSSLLRSSRRAAHHSARRAIHASRRSSGCAPFCAMHALNSSLLRAQSAPCPYRHRLLNCEFITARRQHAGRPAEVAARTVAEEECVEQGDAARDVLGRRVLATKTCILLLHGRKEPRVGALRVRRVGGHGWRKEGRRCPGRSAEAHKQTRMYECKTITQQTAGPTEQTHPIYASLRSGSSRMSGDAVWEDVFTPSPASAAFSASAASSFR